MNVNVNNIKALLDVDNSFILNSVDLAKCIYNRRNEIPIFPKNSEWNFITLSLFLNELDGFDVDSKNSCRLQRNSFGQEYFFMKFFHKFDNGIIHFILINIMKNSLLIIVKANKNFLDTWNDAGTIESHIQKEFLVTTNKPSSSVIFNNSCFYYFDKSNFSSSFISFISSFKSMQIAQKTKYTNHIFEFCKHYYKQEKYEAIDLNDFLHSFEGYFFLTLTEKNNTCKKLDKCYIKDQKYYILRGTYISPYACSLIQNINVAGIMLDTTWMVINNYVTSIPTVVIHNVGIPIGFSFSLAENADIYDQFFFHFENVFGYSIKDFVQTAESDQGKALKKSVSNQNMQHICCLRHLLVSLGKTKFSEQVGNLVSSVSNTDYQDLKNIYEESWASITDEEDKKVLNKLLTKVGLVLNDGKIEIGNADRWVEVSMQIRHQFCMPSCTNQLESSHGHLNAMTPRRNGLWSSISRIVKEILNKVHKFKDHYRNNYTRYKRKVKKIVENTPKDIMEAMLQHYETNIEKQTCNCGEATLLSKMLETKLPCSHLFYLKMPFPKLDPPAINLDLYLMGEVFFEYEIEDSKIPETNFNYYSNVREYVVKIIKKYSHCKNKENEVTSFVEEKLKFEETPSEFALGYPVEIFSVIDKGIIKFIKH